MDMVEKVARVINPGIWSFRDRRLERVGPEHFGRNAEFEKEIALSITRARAAIAAMREPSEAMKHAGAVYDRMGSAPDVARTTWINMIDAALKD